MRKSSDLNMIWTLQNGKLICRWEIVEKNYPLWRMPVHNKMHLPLAFERLQTLDIAA